MRILSRLCAFALAGAFAAPALAQGSGADVVLSDIQSTSNYGVVGAYRGYAIGSNTCNIGTGNLLWTNNGTPALAMNMYRLYNGRLVQIGMGWCKHACCAGATNGCGGGCNGAGGSVLGVNCLDVYGSGFNGGQTRLGARSRINPYTGALLALQSGTFNAIDRRIQVATTDLISANFPNSQYFVEGVYVGSDDAQSRNWTNNATYKRVTVQDSTGNLTLTGSPSNRLPAIFAWRDSGTGPGVPDNTVRIVQVDIPNEGRLFVGSKVIQLSPTSWRYEYAIYNLNSDAGVGGFDVPASGFTGVSDIGWNGVRYHSGEAVDNTAWNSLRKAGEVGWDTPQTFAQNPNSGSIRWGTMHNFWFTADAGPKTGSARVSMFKTIATPWVMADGLEVPGVPCRADVAAAGGTLGRDGLLTVDDLVVFLQQFFANNITVADVTNLGATAGPDGLLSSDDVIRFLEQFFAGCA